MTEYEDGLTVGELRAHLSKLPDNAAVTIWENDYDPENGGSDYSGFVPARSVYTDNGKLEIS